jgi:hypothetical protein
MRTITESMTPRQQQQYAEIQRQLAQAKPDKAWYWQRMLAKLLRQLNQQGARDEAMYEVPRN